MKEKLQNLFRGRQGMDELSKLLFWLGLALTLLTLFIAGGVGALLRTLGLALLFCAFARAFSRNLPMREAENAALLRWREKKKRERTARKDRWSHRRTYKYFKCPGCGTWLRVPRHKGKVHIHCRCGYTLYRRT